jgi:hypothetical protein
LQLNPPAKKSFVVFDIDRAGAALAAEDADLPAPTLTVVNPENKHAHLIYALACPVCVSVDGGAKPQRYLNAIYDAYLQRLGADIRYTGLIAKNPWHPYWETIENGNAVYELATLADYVELAPRRKLKYNAEGRNCTLFDSLAAWSYKAIRGYWAPGGAEAWESRVVAEAQALNVFADMLSEQEVKQIARSVARWTWRHTTPKGFSELQRARVTKRWKKSDAEEKAEAQRARIAKRWEKESKQEQGIELMRQGKSNEEIIRALEVGLTTVKRWRRYFNAL